MKLKLLSLIGLFLVFSCKSTKQDVTPNAHQMLENGKYHVVSLGDSDYSKEDLSLQFDLDKNLISGYTGCNTFSTNFKQDGKLLEMGDARSTMRHCEDKAQMEREFLNGIRDARSYDFEDGQLVIKSADGKVLMRADKIENKLVNGDYEVISLKGKSVNGEGVRLSINTEDQQISGNAGCNSFGSEYNTKDEKINLGLARVTRMHCEGKMELEREFLQTLGEIDVFDFDGKTLQFRNVEGHSLIIARKVANNLKSGDYEVVTLEGKNLEGQEVTLNIDADQNRLSGNAGCNGFGTEYTIDGDQIDLGHARITKMHCEGKMELERAFMKSLGQVKTFQYNGAVLELKTADGKVLITAQPKQ